MFLILLTGMLAGAAHVLLGPDHLAALAPFSIEARRRAWAIGLRWGLGHAAGLGLVGAAFYALSDWLNLELFKQAGDYMVGMVLIAIGAWGFWHLRTQKPALAGHAAGPDSTGPAHFHAGAAVLVGGLHGVAGTGNLVGVLPALGMRSWVEAGTYFGGFAIGTLAAMVGFAALLGALTPDASERTRRAYRRVFGLAAGAALAVGVTWIALPLLGVDLHD